jgi:hypothetical protein
MIEEPAKLQCVLDRDKDVVTGPEQISRVERAIIPAGSIGRGDIGRRENIVSGIAEFQQAIGACR